MGTISLMAVSVGTSIFSFLLTCLLVCCLRWGTNGLLLFSFLTGFIPIGVPCRFTINEKIIHVLYNTFDLQINKMPFQLQHYSNQTFTYQVNHYLCVAAFVASCIRGEFDDL